MSSSSITVSGHTYVECAAADIPERVRFGVRGRDQGQAIQVAYGTFAADGPAPGDPYLRVTDETNAVTYFRLARRAAKG